MARTTVSAVRIRRVVARRNPHRLRWRSTSGSSVAKVAPLRWKHLIRASSTWRARRLAGKTLPPGSTSVRTPSASNSSTSCRGPKAASAEWRNRPFGPNAMTIPRASVAWVRLQWPPPEIRILTPGRRFFSSSSVRRPRAAARQAARSPAGPPPTTTTDQSSIDPVPYNCPKCAGCLIFSHGFLFALQIALQRRRSGGNRERQGQPPILRPRLSGEIGADLPDPSPRFLSQNRRFGGLLAFAPPPGIVQPRKP